MEVDGGDFGYTDPTSFFDEKLVTETSFGVVQSILEKRPQSSTSPDASQRKQGEKTDYSPKNAHLPCVRSSSIPIMGRQHSKSPLSSSADDSPFGDLSPLSSDGFLSDELLFDISFSDDPSSENDELSSFEKVNINSKSLESSIDEDQSMCFEMPLKRALKGLGIDSDEEGSYHHVSFGSDSEEELRLALENLEGSGWLGADLIDEDHDIHSEQEVTAHLIDTEEKSEETPSSEESLSESESESEGTEGVKPTLPFYERTATPYPKHVVGICDLKSPKPTISSSPTHVQKLESATKKASKASRDSESSLDVSAENNDRVQGISKAIIPYVPPAHYGFTHQNNGPVFLPNDVYRAGILGSGTFSLFPRNISTLGFFSYFNTQSKE